MKRYLVGLAGILCAFSAQAITESDLITNLKSRLHPLSHDKGSLIKSYVDHSQSYIYDQALAIIAFTKANEKKSARKLLKGLESLQLNDGSLYFSYNMDGTSVYPQEGDKRIAGAISWVALAAVHYQSKFHEKEFYSFNHKLLTYLHSEIVPVGNVQNALRFAPHDLKETEFNEKKVAALEHNLDAFAAFVHFSKLNKSEKWKDDISHLKKFILSMWDKNNKHFWSGANVETGATNKSELYLDNQTWSLLALDKETLKEISPKEALEYNCEVFQVKDEGIEGFLDSKPTRSPARDKFVWSEGTFGQLLAMNKVKMKTCNDLTVSDYMESLKKMKTSDGGIAYATLTKNKDFTNSSSVAGTAWMYFAMNGINPFSL